MWPFAVAMEGGRCFMSSTIRLIQVVKWPFLMAWSKVLWTGLNSVAWYHCDISGLLLTTRALSYAGCCCLGGWSGLMVRLICHMPDVFKRVPSNTVMPYFTKLR